MEVPKVHLTGTEWGGSRISKYLTCRRKYWLTYHAGHDRIGLIKVGQAPAREFGSAFHEFAYWFYTQLATNPDAVRSNLEATVVDGCKVAVDYLETIGFTDDVLALLSNEIITAIDLYIKNYEGEILGTAKGLIPLKAEVPFEVKIGNYIHTGRIDLVGDYSGYRVIPDHKTTGKDWNRFFQGFKLDLSQRGYAYGYYQLTGERAHVLINGVRRRKTKDFDVEFMRDLIKVTDRDFKEFEAIVTTARSEIDAKDPSDSTQWIQNSAACVSDYVCEFHELCKYPETEASHFAQRVIESTPKGGE